MTKSGALRCLSTRWDVLLVEIRCVVTVLVASVAAEEVAAASAVASVAAASKRKYLTQL